MVLAKCLIVNCLQHHGQGILNLDFRCLPEVNEETEGQFGTKTARVMV